MTINPIAKINLGLNVVRKRPDGYHDLETVFYPVPVEDALEITPVAEGEAYDYPCRLTVSNIHIEGDTQNNLVVRAYNRIAEHYPLPPVKVHLYKGIPTQAGMGGGSSDAAYMIRLLNEMFSLGMSIEEMQEHALSLGADCPFFIQAVPAYAEGVGERLAPIALDLRGWYIAIVRPDIPVPTKEAFSRIVPHLPEKNCREIVARPVETWRVALVNDFEESVFALHPEIGAVKERLYELGATYAAMSGSGSSLFGLFRDEPLNIENEFPGMFCVVKSL